MNIESNTVGNTEQSSGMVAKPHVMVINHAIKTKNINHILTVCQKTIGKSSVDWFFYNSIESGNKIGYVYFLVKNNEVVYIGASSDRNRIGRHQKNKNFDEVYYLPCENYYHWKIETLLIRNFKTKYNCCNVSKCSFK